jgi:hypothetical protein
MRFNVLLEKLEEYIFPANANEEMADFYMLELLSSNIESSDKDLNEEDILFIKDAAKKFLPKLKDKILKDISYGIYREIRHLKDESTEGQEWTEEKEKTLIELRDNIIKLDADAIKIAEQKFEDPNIKWANMYGGANWAKICKGWLRLNDASSNKELFMAIDNVYDLQHNTGSIFNKVERYSIFYINHGKDIESSSAYGWIKDFLDLKYESTNPWDLYEYLSHSLKPVVGRLLHKIGYGTAENQQRIKDNTEEFINYLRLQPKNVTTNVFQNQLDRGIDIHYNKEQILKAIIENSYDIELLKAAVKAGSNIFVKDYMILYITILNLQFFKFLVEQGVEFKRGEIGDIQDAIAAAPSRYETIVEYLIENSNKLKINEDRWAFLAFELIVNNKEGHLKLFELLLEKKKITEMSLLLDVPLINKLEIFFGKAGTRFEKIIELFKKYNKKFEYNLASQGEEITDKDLQGLYEFIRGTFKKENGLINVEGHVELHLKSGNKFKKIPYKFGKINGSFICSQNELTDLEGAPTFVTGVFDCSHNQLTTLKGSPTTVESHFICYKNKLQTLEGAPQSIGGFFDCAGNPKKFTRSDLPTDTVLKSSFHT